jgi:hypothetical protein
VTRIDFVGFKGEFTEVHAPDYSPGPRSHCAQVKDEAVVTVYEAQAKYVCPLALWNLLMRAALSPADHPKIPGLDGMMSSNPG